MPTSRSRLVPLGRSAVGQRPRRAARRWGRPLVANVPPWPDPAIRLLGAPAVRLGATWEPLRPCKSSALLTYVARRSGSVRRAELAALLWPERDEQRAHTNLRQLLKGLGSGPLRGCLERDRDSVRCLLASDVHAFERALDDARWTHAVELYAGSLLEGFDAVDAGGFGAWLADERATVEGRWRHACLVLLDGDRADGWAMRCLALADRLLRADPLDEVALRHAMRSAAALGDTVAARQRFERFERALARDLAMTPDAETRALAAEPTAGRPGEVDEPR